MKKPSLPDQEIRQDAVTQFSISYKEFSFHYGPSQPQHLLSSAISFLVEKQRKKQQTDKLAFEKVSELAGSAALCAKPSEVDTLKQTGLDPDNLLKYRGQDM